MKKLTRGEFLKLSGMTIPAVTIATSANANDIKSPDSSPLKLGLASYTLRHFSLDDTIKMTVRLGLTGITLKSMHMPLEASNDEIRGMAEKVRKAGLDLYGAGVIYMKTKEEVENAFRYATAAGLNMIIGVPNHELLPLVNEKVKSTNIRLAIHNHGPGDDLYRAASDVYNKIKDLDKRIGLCIDIGHVQRIGEDPATMLERYKDRLYDMHMKDVIKNSTTDTPVEIGRGMIDIPKVIRTLKKINYKETVAIEFEKDDKDPMPGLAESVGYIKGVIRSV